MTRHEKDLPDGSELEQARSELARIKGDSTRIDRLADRLKAYMEANSLTERLVIELMRGYR